MAVESSARRILLGMVARFLRFGAAEKRTVLVGRPFSLRAALLLAELAEIDDLGHRLGYFLRKASSETTSAPFWVASAAGSGCLAAGSALDFGSPLRPPTAAGLAAAASGLGSDGSSAGNW